MGRAENVMLIRSLGKSLALPAGASASSPASRRLDACLRELEWDVIRVSHVAQRAATAALEGPQDWLDEVAARYRADRDAAHAVIAERPDPERGTPGRHAVPLARSGRTPVGEPAGGGRRGRRRRRLRRTRLRATAIRRRGRDRRRAPPPPAARDVVSRIGVDIGGTFTDVVLLGDDGTLQTKKVLSTPDDYARGVVQGILELLAGTGVLAGEVTKVVHATTVASNAVLGGQGRARALITTDGFRDVLEMRRLRIPVMYDLQYEKPAPLVPRRLRFEVPERMGPRGEVWRRAGRGARAPRGRAGARRGRRGRRDQLLHAYANPAHERRAAEIVRDVVGDDVYVTCSSEILAEIREYERTSTAVVNAYVGPVVEGYLRSLVEPADGRDLGAAPDHAVERRRDEPAGRDAEAGAPGGVRPGGRRHRLRLPRARRPGMRNVISLDMGGTTAKAAILEDGQPVRTSEYEVGAGINLSSRLVKGGGYAIRLPFIDISEIGAGGGSIVAVDGFGMLHVGPDSAGADPGPGLLRPGRRRRRRSPTRCSCSAT